ncbi:hypothetical protein AMS68_003185 [Peltaster fructicola]|uniref:Uncharacterized protein n=1 Tax=Peltaster fructicola TaxID=286661 RepID=A0A6H0XSS2_9PEZI|nr:hypothetical protein AMS68_003185 [Peltaster fructicola]
MTPAGQDLAHVGASVIRCYDAETAHPPELRIFHYNDVYHVEAGSKEPVGGVPRFQTMRNFYANDTRFAGQSELLTFFSGDAFNPSLESTITKGKHMVPVLNNLGTHVACLGNHDLDFGVEQFKHLAKLCNFPWLCSNVLDPSLGEKSTLGECRRTMMVTSTNGIKVGLIGLVEQEWLDAIYSLPPDLQFVQPSLAAKELVPILRAQGADIIIALAHQRMPNDQRLAQEIEPGLIDIILGGHDHTFEYATINGTPILRSGTDFKQFSYIEAKRRDGQHWDFNIIRHDVMSTIAQDPNSLAMITAITEALEEKLEKPVGYIAAPLDARFTTVRLAESNLGNFICDLMRLHYDADCCIVCGGTIRGDQVYPPGILKVKDVVNCLPFEDTCVVVKLPGRALVEALENGVSKWPALDGRFPQVSGISFAFDPSRTAGDRCTDIKVAGRPVELDKEYTLATRDFMCAGKDGYHMLMDTSHGGKVRVTVPEESGLMLSMLVRQYFMSLKVLGQWRHWSKSMSRHWRVIQDDLHGTHPVRSPKQNGIDLDPIRDDMDDLPLPRTRFQRRQGPHRWHADGSFDLSDSEDEVKKPTRPGLHREQSERDWRVGLARRAFRKWWTVAGLHGRPELVEEPGEGFGARWTRAIAPQLEGRIRVVGISTACGR